MSYAELKAKLAEMGLPTTGNTATLQERYDNAIANATASTNDNAAADNSADNADNVTIESVVVNGVACTPMDADNETIKEFISKRRQREFPQLLQIVPDGRYETTGRYSLYEWENGEEISPIFLIVEIMSVDDNSRYWVGEWEFPARTFGIRLQDGTEFTPEWVLDDFVQGSARSELVRRMPAGTTCAKHSGIGRWLSKAGERNYSLAWISRN